MTDHATPANGAPDDRASADPTPGAPGPGNPGPAPDDRLARMTLAELDALSDTELARLLGATDDQIATEPTWTWRAAARAATDEYAARLIADVDTGRAHLTTDPDEIRRRLGGRPRVGGTTGTGPSIQVRVRVTTATRTALEDIATTQGRRLAEVSRDALDEYVTRHAS